jgi:flavin-dependent dehydrogenase
MGARQHLALAPWHSYVEVWWQHGIEAYITPSGPEQIEVAFLWDRQRCRPPVHQGLAGLLSIFPQLAAQVQHAATRSHLRGLGPLAVAAARPVAGRILLIGDALMFLDGLTGEGLSIGFAQAELVAQHLPPLYDLTRLDADALLPLATALRHRLAAHLGVTRLALDLTRHPWLRTLSMRALSRAPGLLQHALEVNMGTRRPWPIPLSSVPRLAWGLMLPRRAAPFKAGSSS